MMLRCFGFKVDIWLSWGDLNFVILTDFMFGDVEALTLELSSNITNPNIINHLHPKLPLSSNL